ncbi:MAG: CHAT domain-containing protein, partial [Planctomycetaceae bacterium]|nr:CHAT domain-containing protein [Planctomycetaceae bacterium]
RRVTDPKSGNSGWIRNQDVATREFTAAEDRQLDHSDQLVADADELSGDDNDNDKALEKYEEGLQVRRRLLGEQHIAVAYCYAGAADCMTSLGDYEGAARYYREALRIRELVLDENDVDIAAVCNALGWTLLQIGTEKETEALCRRALAIVERQKEPSQELLLDCLSNLGAWYKRSDDSQQAIPYFERAIRISKEVYGNSVTTADLEYELADCDYLLERYQQAEAIFRRLEQTYTELQGADHENTAYAQYALGNSLERLERYTEAEAALRRSLKTRLKLLGEDDEQTAFTLHDLAVVLERQTRYLDAEPFYRRALEIRRKLLGSEDPDTLNSMYCLGSNCFMLAKYDEAEPLLKEAVTTAERVLGEDDEETARYREELVRYLTYSLDLDEAEKISQQVLKARRKLFGEQHEDIAHTLLNIGFIHERRGDYSEAEDYYRQAMEMFRKTSGENSYGITQALRSLGWLQIFRGEDVEARTSFEKMLAIHRKSPDLDNLDTSDAEHGLATALADLGDYNKADELLRKVLKTEQRLLGNDSDVVAKTLLQLGWVADLRGEPQECAKFTQQSYDILVRILGTEHPETADCLRNLSVTYRRAGNLVESERLLQQCLRIYEQKSEDSAFVAGVVHLLGFVYFQMKDYDKAEEFTRRGLKITQKILGRDSPENNTALTQLATLAMARDRLAEATRYVDECRRIVRRHTSKILPGLSERAQQKYLAANFRDDFIWALSLGLAGKDDPRTAALSAGWLLNGKAVAQEVLAEAALLSRAEAAPLVKELRSVRDGIARLTLQADGEDQRTRLADLEAQQQRLQQQIAEYGLGLQKADPWMAVGTLRDRLPFDSVFINIARFQIAPVSEPVDFHDWDRNLQPARYVAWIIPPTGGGEIRLVDLGEADPVDQQVTALRKLLPEVIAQLAEKGERTTEAAVRQQLDVLSDMLLRPLEPFLKDVSEVILSPDGELWSVPWNALLTADDRYLVETYRTRFVLSGRELVYRHPERAAVSEPVIFADPDFDHSANTAVLAENVNSIRTRSGTRSQSGQTFPPLTSSAAEAAAIRPQLEGYSGSSARVFLQDEAVEATFKSLHRPRILMLSTHGFFLPPPESAGRTATGETYKDAVVFDNPLTRCGLALAGCNATTDLASPNIEDGILTGLEIVGTDLRGTELVVLSACETGLGDIQVGEGVAGLRHAFQLAGAESVVSSLWQVEDNETARLMSLFFTNLANGLGKSEALRQAQLTRIQSRRERNGAAHPFFWAAFTLTGGE